MTTETRPAETMVSVAVLRRLCGAAPGEIEALIRSRALIARAGKVSLVAGVRAFLDAIRATAKSASLSAAQDAARGARADAAELALAVDARRLVQKAEAEDALAHLCGAIMSRTFTISARATRDVRERRVIEDAIRVAQQEIAIAATEIDLSEKPAPAKRRANR